MGTCASKADQVADNGNKPEAKGSHNYERIKTLGVGASCEVIVGKRRSNDKLYAVKILKRDGPAAADNEYLFRNEVMIMKRLKHENIVEYVESFEDNKTYQIVTVLCLGGELFDRVAEGSFSERVASHLTKQMLLSLAHCHERHITHRDLKPENFVFETKSIDSNMKLIDFGCAVAAADDDPVKDVAGSPYYVAPEVLSNDVKRTGKIWQQADMWSIGVIVYLLVHGYPPFNAEQQDQIFAKIRVGKFRFSRDSPLSDSVKNFIQKLLIRDPLQRMTAREALRHPWIADHNAVPDTPLSDAVIKSLTEFRSQCRLKKAVAKVLAKHMTDDDEKELQALFKKFDTNGDGRLSAEEIANMMKAIGANPADAKELMNQVDENNDGVISQDEFRVLHAQGKLSSSPDDVKRGFDMFDIDGDGFVTHDEIAKICRDLSPAVVKSLIADVDKNGDGKVSFAEWMVAMNDMKTKKK
jgi:calcium-dependent protein kinase